VLVTSLVIVRRKLSYEWWYAIHFTAYAGIALAWFHMIPDGNELIANVKAADYWRALFFFALAIVIWYRLAWPVINTFRYGIRVTEVIHEGPGVVSLRLKGRGLDRLGTKAGQFYFWRFFTKGFWYTQHPFSLSEAPHGDTFRITVKNLGDHSAKFGEIPVGTRVFAEGPFGVFTDASRTLAKELLIAGRMWRTPVRALLEDMDGDLVVLYRVVSADDLVFADELDAPVGGARVKVTTSSATTRARRARPALAGPPARARSGHHRKGRIHLRADRHDRRHRPESQARRRAAGSPARRAVRPVSFFQLCSTRP
jgi:predicted ferric reductase